VRFVSEHKRLATILGAFAAVALLVGAGFGIRALVGGDDDGRSAAAGVQLGADDDETDATAADNGEGGEGGELDECEEFLCDEDGNVVIGLDGNPVRLGPDGQPIWVDADGNPIPGGLFPGLGPGGRGPGGPGGGNAGDDWPTDAELAALRQAYVDAYRAACFEIWSISPTGALDDPYDEELYYVDDCLDEMDEDWAELADDVAEAREMGREDALEAAYYLSLDGRLCYRATCWEHPDYGF
jgi:hypothetical protein